MHVLPYKDAGASVTFVQPILAGSDRGTNRGSLSHEEHYRGLQPIFTFSDVLVF